MPQSEHDRRRSIREATSYHVTLRSAEGEVLTEGMTTNFSNEGAFLVTKNAPGLPVDCETVLEVQMPSEQGQGEQMHRFKCRVVRFREMGKLVGLGLEFVEQID